MNSTAIKIITRWLLSTLEYTTCSHSRNRYTYAEIPTAQLACDRYPTAKTGNNEIKDVTKGIVRVYVTGVLPCGILYVIE